MRIAVSYELEDGTVFFHVGDTLEYKVYDVEDGNVVKAALYPMNGTGRSAVVDFCKEYKVETLICGTICGGAKDALKELGVQVIGCVEGDADEAVNAFLRGELSDNGTVACHHED